MKTLAVISSGLAIAISVFAISLVFSLSTPGPKGEPGAKGDPGKTVVGPPGKDATSKLGSGGYFFDIGTNVPVPVSNGGTGATSFTTGSVVFSDGTNLTEDNTNFFFDNTNDRLGISTSSPWGSVAIEQIASGDELLPAFVISDTGTATPSFVVLNGNGYVGVGTNTPGSVFSVGDNMYVAATTTTGGLLATSSVQIEGSLAIGTNTPSVLVDIGSGVGTSTAVIRGGPSTGGELIIASSDGSACILLVATRGAIDIGAAATLETLFKAKVIACPN